MRLLSACLLILALGTAQAEGRAYLLGAGVDADSDGGIRGGMMAGVEIGEATWVSGGLSASEVELSSGRSSSIRYGDIELDHHFDPFGITMGLAYWGDPDILDSIDRRLSLYFRNDRVTIAAAYELRDFDFIIPPSDFFVGREFAFDAKGIGGRARLKLTDSVSLSASAIKYDYSVDFLPDENRDAVQFFAVSRLSLINSLIDDRASIDIGVNVGSSHWELDYTTWQGTLDDSRTNSVTLYYMRPLSMRTDIEFGLGYDESETYGDVTYLSLNLYFYGG